jgi:hypothetical protein
MLVCWLVLALNMTLLVVIAGGSMVHTTAWPVCEEQGCLLYMGGSPWLCTERQEVTTSQVAQSPELQVYLYNIAQQRWRHLTWQKDSPRPLRRWFASLTDYQNKGGEHALLLVGGVPSQLDESETWELRLSGVLLL